MSAGEPGVRRYTQDCLHARNRVFRELREGADAEDEILQAVFEAGADRVLEVGCGFGELAERMANELSANVVATDVSPQMVERTAARGVDARRADVHELPFATGAFDCVVAAWMLFHTSVDLAVKEIARVLHPGGRLVATTYASGNFRELWIALEDESGNPELSFGEQNGEDVLRRYFARIERREIKAWTVFPDTAAVRAFVQAASTRSHLAVRAATIDTPLRVSNHQIVFVAETTA